MKKMSNSTKATIALVVLLIAWGVGRSLVYRGIVHTISHEATTPAAVEAARKLVLQRKLARVFKDTTNHAKYQAIRTCQVFALDPEVVEIEGHHISMAEAASGALVEFLSDLELRVRAEAADALGRMGQAAARPLLEVALNSPDKDVRSNATRALVAIGHVAVPEMIEAVKTGKPTMKVGAATALGRLRTPRGIPSLISALSAKEPEVRLTCRDALVGIGTPSVEPLIEALEATSPFTRRHSAEALGEIADPAGAEPLMRLVEDEHRLVRLAATYAVGKVGDPIATDVLLGKLGDSDREMREAAAVSLGQIADQRAVPELINVLEDPVEAVREQAARALGRIGPQDPRALADIELASRSGSEGTRYAAVFALGQIGDPGCVAAVAARLRSDSEPSERVRRRAAAALGAIGSPAGVSHLITAFSDPDWRVNYLAQDALAQIGEPAVEPLFDVFSEGQALPARYARKALGKMNPPPTEALAELVRAPNEAERLGAAQTLADIASRESLELLRTVCLKDPDPKVRYAAERCLAARGEIAEAPSADESEAPSMEDAAPAEEAPAATDDSA